MDDTCYINLSREDKGRSCKALSAHIWKGPKITVIEDYITLHPKYYADATMAQRVVQPDAVCEVGGSTPGLPHGDVGISLGEAKQRNMYIS